MVPVSGLGIALRALLISSLLALLALPPASCLVFNSTALVFASTENDGRQTSYILDGYGIGYDTITLTTGPNQLPALESSAGGNYGLFVIIEQAQINSTSLLTQDQWNTLYAYQEKYGVRMVHAEASPDPTLFGVTALTPCCNGTQEQYISLVGDVASDELPTAGLRVANLTTVGLFHSPGSIVSENASTTTAFLNFLPNELYNGTTVAGVINHFDGGRDQMAIFVASGNWSSTTAFFNHAWVQWGYRGLYQGFRRIYLSSQIDDLFLTTTTYNSERAFRIRSADLSQHLEFTAKLNANLNTTNPGSAYFTEFGFNANGNIAYSYDLATNLSISCPGPLFTSWSEPSTALEYQKPVGIGRNSWPSNPKFDWTSDCCFIDPLAQFFLNLSNRDAIGLVSHTFTHLDLDKSTYHDTLREISFNLEFAELMNFTNALKFSGGGLIPPAITGLHNGDALRAFSDNGLWHAIGDNTRPVLRANQNYHWPRMSDSGANGYNGYQITPRFSTRVYYNCDIIDCDLSQCLDTADCIKSEGMDGLLALERKFVPNQLLSLFHDPYMFHQPNLRQIDVANFTVNGVNAQYSLLQMWLTVVTSEIARLVDWPILTLRQDDLSADFNKRMARDACSPYIQYHTSNSSGNSTQGQITGFTVSAVGGRVSGSLGGNITIDRESKYIHKCTSPIPVTIPRNTNFTGAVMVNNGTRPSIDNQINLAAYRLEQIGNESPILWVKIDGDPVTFQLTNGVDL